MTRRAPHVTRAATLGGALALIILSSADGVRTQTAAPGRVIWRGVMTEMTSSPSCEEQVVQTFEFEGDERETGTTWRSRKVTWNQSLTCAKDVLMLVDEDGDATTPPRRMLRPWGGSCANQGEADLQSTPDPSVRSRCQETPRLGFISARTLPTLGWTGPRPDDQMRDGCAFNTRSRTLGSDGTVGLITVSITVSRGQPDAVVEVNRPEYDAFVPEPGKTLTFTARSARPARFRFELERDGTSRFPGYATNANVDDAFFLKHNLTHLRGKYANDGADMIFDPERFSSVGWSRRDLHFVETRTAEMSALVPVTAMDYGAVSRLRAYVESADCGGSWQPIAVSIGGQRRDAIDVPLDADNNLIADALEPYRGLDSGADTDAEPKGNGMAGDGLTAFEEYRGFLTRGPACAAEPVSASTPEPGLPAPEPFPDEQTPSGIPGWEDEHIRTTPHHKDLFIQTLDPELAAMAAHFAWASDLSVHPICEPHYVDRDTRVVNFTLQQASVREWRGKRISQEEPQHGIYIETFPSLHDGALGIVAPVDPLSDRFGPPKFTLGVAIVKPYLIADRGIETNSEYRRRVQDQSELFTRVLTHELSHAVGIPHHADEVQGWERVSGKLNIDFAFSVFQRNGDAPPRTWTEDSRRIREDANIGGLLVLGAAACEEHHRMYRDGQYVGCWAQVIARRGQQNSGDFECPMRYWGADYYEAPGSTAVYRWTGFVGGVGPGFMNVDAWDGNLLKYHNELDRRPRGKLCARTRGTEINGLPGDMNHSGDAGRDKPCREFLVVNDMAARGVR